MNGECCFKLHCLDPLDQATSVCHVRRHVYTTGSLSFCHPMDSMSNRTTVPVSQKHKRHTKIIPEVIKVVTYIHVVLECGVSWLLQQWENMKLLLVIHCLLLTPDASAKLLPSALPKTEQDCLDDWQTTYNLHIVRCHKVQRTDILNRCDAISNVNSL